jgi:hypothetical protein
MSWGVFSRSNVSRNVVAPNSLNRVASAIVAGRTTVVIMTCVAQHSASE